ncbi:6,7-dimethyl-8-ribityllumazine synthase [Candidatus Saccharibacteria bacterium RIFCSPHIGHO2_12_FULL_41_12]|nr:MAG: 6,7-dimethyl-8-ribityllumazine synthase [Candidatus Saccharibacteria bacterium RIFCSPHIGHO2_12_FULL_41_12]
MTQIPNKSKVSTFDASGWKIGIVVAQFNSNITKQLLKNVLQRAKDYKINRSDIEVIHVAGSVEIPLLLQTMAKKGTYDALVALGCVVKGETAHFDYVCKYATEGILRVQLDHCMPIAFGVLMCDNFDQAESRTHLSGEHLDAVLHQAKATKSLK